MTTIKELVNQVQGELGMAKSTRVFGATDGIGAQMEALLKRVAADIKHVKPWPQLATDFAIECYAAATTGDTVAGSAVVTNIPSTADYEVGFVVTGDGFTDAPRNDSVRIVSVDSATQITVSREAATTAVGGAVTVSQDRYALPDNFDATAFDTFWEQSKSWQMLGPMTAAEWANRKNGIISTFPTRGFRIFGGTSKKLALDVPPAVSDSGNVFSFEYLTRNTFAPVEWSASQSFVAGDFCSYDGNIYQTASGGTSGTHAPTHASGSATDGGVTWAYYSAPYEKPMKDTDTCVFDDALIETGLKFYFSKAKRLKYDDYEADYRNALEACRNKLGGAATVSMSGGGGSRFIGFSSIPDSGYGQ